MPRGYGVVHPRLRERLAPIFYDSLVTIQVATEGQGGAGQVTQTWANLAKHVDLRCRVSPSSSGNRRESRTEVQTYAVHTWHITLTTYQPEITEKMRAVSGGAVYDIELVETDGNRQFTRLMCRVVK